MGNNPKIPAEKGTLPLSMAVSSPFLSTLRKKKSPVAGALFRLSGLTDRELVLKLIDTATEVCTGSKPARFQRKNARSLIRKIKILLGLFEFLRDSSTADRLSSSARLCFREIHILLERTSDLLACCGQSSNIWILLYSVQIAEQFHDLNQDISTCLDVLSLKDLDLSDDVQEQISLLKVQSWRSKLYLDPKEESLRKQIYAFVDDFNSGRTPDLTEIRSLFVDGLQISDATAFRKEIDFLEGQICRREEDIDEIDLSLLHSVVALSRFARFSLLSLNPESENLSIHRTPSDQSSSSSLTAPPRDFCCPISLDLMTDPVILSTGQTYDRSSIARWIEEGHVSCPYSGQPLRSSNLVPNKALRNLILQWCSANGVNYDYPEPCSFPSTLATRAAVEANRATAKLLVEKLSRGRDSEQTVAAMELRLLAKNGAENRASIAEVGAIPLLHRLLSSSNPLAQENSVTAILNLSILEKNKILIMEQAGCLKSIVQVLVNGKTEEARENAAATLFSLSAVHEHKKPICEEAGALEALSGLLERASQRGKKDSITAMYNLCTHGECWKRVIESGAASAMIRALGDETVAEEAAGALGLLMRQPLAAAEVAGIEGAVEGLVGVMRGGSARGKENAVAALVAMCRGGGAEMAERVARAPAMAAMLHSLHATGTKRARRKAASLARLCYRCQVPVESRRSAYSVSDISVSLPISVPVL